MTAGTMPSYTHDQRFKVKLAVGQA